MANKIQASFARFVQPLEGCGEIGNVSLFVISTKNPGLKKLNLEGLSSEEKAARLKVLGESFRFVLVVEASEGLVAHVHKNYATDLNRLGSLSLDGKKFTVRSLSDEDAASLAAIGAEWEGLLTDELEDKETDEKEGDQASCFNQPSAYAKVFDKALSRSSHSRFLIAQLVKRNMSQLILDCMKRFEEARRDLEKQKAADEKRSDIIRAEIKRQILREDVVKEEIQHQELKRFIM